MKRFFCFLTVFAMLFSSLAVDISDESPAPAVLVAEAAPSKLIAFTFDDGPGFYTDDLLDGLAARGAKATFFVNGENGSALGAAFHGDLLKRMVKDGHQIGNHTYHHRVPFDGLSASEMVSQVNGVNTYLYNAVGGHYQTLVRTPGGANSATIRQNVNAPIILWSVDTLDWKYRNADTVYHNIMTKAHDGAVVLLHDIYSTSVNGALRAITDLQKQGYECVTVSELFRRRGITLQNGTVYTSAQKTGVNRSGYSAPTVTDTLNTVNGKATVTFTMPHSGMTLYYTTDGSTPTMSSHTYRGPFDVNYGTTIRVAGFDAFGTRTPVAQKKPDQSYEGAFDAAFYANKYADLKKAFGNNEGKLLNHFITYGIEEGRQASPTFNVKYYMNRYPELGRVLGSDPAQYMRYFLTTGMAQGQRGSAEFDPVSYRLYYPDLRNSFGDNWKAYYTHYLRHGKKEGRLPTGCSVMRNPTTVYNGVDYAPVYDFTYYTSRYSDLQKAFGYNDTAALKHFINNGMKEGRVGSERFRVQLYKAKYKDLQKAFGNNLKAYYNHYLKYGIKEGRTAT